jgi:tetratricopeptide (TPR) repeat protein
MPFCEQCGAPAEPGQKFCESCGAPMKGDSAGSAGTGPEKNLAEYWLEKGIERDERMDYAGAVDAYDRALSVRQDFYEALFNRGYDLIILRRYQEAEESFARAITIFPDDAYALKYRALALHELGRRAEAVELMEKARQIQPDILES